LQFEQLAKEPINTTAPTDCEQLI